jgi:alpha-glucosidase (family GH31 glycosyl hydrolase)
LHLGKFPDGASGDFAKELRSEGIKLAGILKPRILLYKKGSTSEMHEAAAYAQAHDLWYPDEPMSTDYFTGRPTRDLDFSKAETRSWYWKHLEPAFDAGMLGWWNDEADNAGVGGGRTFTFDNFQFLNMERALYDGQRGHSNLRVWSLNRNYYLGAQRYGYAEWSGDIQSGFQSMQYQRMRMLATLDAGEPHWSMDTGGFFGHPTPENYARWIEFATFVPIDRVHGDKGEKRQPWVYGPVAEAAATKAIRLRYELLP